MKQNIDADFHVWTEELTKMRAETRPARIRRRQRASIQLTREAGFTLSPLSTKSSSNTKGNERASANGHPTMAPVANNMVAQSVLLVFLTVEGSNANAKASVVAYMAKEEGKKAVIL